MAEYETNLTDFLPYSAIGISNYNAIQRANMQDFAMNQLYNRGVTFGSALDKLYRERSPENWEKFRQVFERYNKYSNYKNNKAIMNRVGGVLGTLGRRAIPFMMGYEMLQQPLGE